MEAKKRTHTKIDIINEIADLITKRTGNIFSEKHKTMIESRLHSRMLALEIEEWSDYYSYVQDNQDTELEELDSLLTTHHTFFFREFVHFEFIKDNLEKLVGNARKRGERVIKIWSAASSRGHEVYSLAMYLEYYLPKLAPDFSYKILGTDIDHNSIDICNNGVYRFNEVSQIPIIYLGDHWARGQGEIVHFAKIKKTIREKCDFRKMNLKLIPFEFTEKFDLIFCRNVLIYFSPDDVFQVSKKLIKHLHENSYLITGLSEPIPAKELRLNALGSCVYTNAEVQALQATAITPPPVESVLIKVFCVDDSPSVIKILQKVFVKENGYELVGTAANGVEAAQKIPKLKIDLVTLDIHMPEMDGITYLERNFRPGHPPVIMLTSVGKDEGDTIQRALRFGASDHVEKPSLGSLTKSAEEIKNKAKLVIGAKAGVLDASALKNVSALSSKLEITHPKKKWIIWVIEKNRDAEVQRLKKDLPKDHPPIFLVIKNGYKPLLIDEFDGQNAQINHVYYVQNETQLAAYFDKVRPEKVCALFSAEFSSFWRHFLLTKKDRFIVFEDGRSVDPELFQDSKFDQVPFASFSAVITRNLNRM